MPFAYFKNILKDELNEILSTQTNLYSMQETAQPINTAWGEIEQLIGICYIGLHMLFTC